MPADLPQQSRVESSKQSDCESADLGDIPQPVGAGWLDGCVGFLNQDMRSARGSKKGMCAKAGALTG